jgi:hypothetical protein
VRASASSSTADDAELIEAANAEAGVSWLFSFLTAARRQTYSLYEAPSPDALLDAARRAGLPADVIVEVKRVSADLVRAESPAGA